MSAACVAQEGFNPNRRVKVAANVTEKRILTAGSVKISGGIFMQRTSAARGVLSAVAVAQEGFKTNGRVVLHQGVSERANTNCRVSSAGLVFFERMRTEGANFLQRNSALAEEVRRTFVDLDEVERELRKASKAIETVSGMNAKYRGRLQVLCDTAAPRTPECDPGDGCSTRRVVWG